MWDGADGSEKTRLYQFVKAFGASLDPRLWLKLIEEETLELQYEVAHANKLAALKESADLAYVLVGYGEVSESIHFMPEDELREVLTTLRNATATLESAFKRFGFEDKMAEAFQRVHESNMSKLGDDGKPIRREDGKILKGPNYKAPDLKDLVE